MVNEPLNRHHIDVVTKGCQEVAHDDLVYSVVVQPSQVHCEEHFTEHQPAKHIPGTEAGVLEDVEERVECVYERQ